MVWNPQNVRTVSQKTSQHAADFNILEGVTLHGAPEFVLSGGKIVVAEYQVPHFALCSLTLLLASAEHEPRQRQLRGGGSLPSVPVRPGAGPGAGRHAGRRPQVPAISSLPIPYMHRNDNHCKALIYKQSATV